MRGRAAARDSGCVSAEVTLAGERGFRLYRFGRTVCARLTLLSRRSRVFRSAHAAHCWPEQHTEVLFDPAGSFDAQLAEERVAAGKAIRAGAPATDWADRLPEAEAPSGPDLEGSYAKRGRDPLAAERRGEAIIATKTGKMLAPSLRPHQRERARRRVAAIARDAAGAQAGKRRRPRRRSARTSMPTRSGVPRKSSGPSVTGRSSSTWRPFRSPSALSSTSPSTVPRRSRS